MANGMAIVMADDDGDCHGQWPTARAMATAMADGIATEMAAAMVDGDRNGNG